MISQNIAEEPKLGKTSYTQRNKAEWLLIMQIIFFNSIFMRVNLPTHIYPTRNWQLLLILTHWTYSNCKDILHTLNLFKIIAKEHQVVDRWDADEISVS